MSNPASFRKILWLFLIFLFVFLFTGLIRNRLLQVSINKSIKKVDQISHIPLQVQDARFTGFSSVFIKKITLANINSQSFIALDSLNLQLNIFNLLLGKIYFKEVTIQQITVSYSKSDLMGINSLLDTSTFNKTKVDGPHYSKILNRSLKTFFTYIPANFVINHLQMNYFGVKDSLLLIGTPIVLNQHKLNGKFKVLKNKQTLSEFDLQGKINAENKEITLTVSKLPGNSCLIPIFEPNDGLSLQFDTLQFQFEVIHCSADKINLISILNAHRLIIQHPKIANDPVLFHQMGIQFNTKVGNHYFELDSCSYITVNDLTVHLYMYYEHTKHQTLLLKLEPFEFEAQQLINSFPEGLFSELRTMKASGKLGYSFLAKFHSEKPDSLVIESILRGKEFSIQKFGEAKLAKLNDTFTYSIYDNDCFIRSIFIGPANRNYHPLETISPFLKNSVITSEDGGFYYHQGFDQEAIKNALMDNLRKGRFARGGSTITMQLVKNVFLTQQKTLSRKMEEWFMVWMIENLQLVSKDRMLEVYLNIIEWGPGIYGIGEASQFYFNKKPIELNLNESIFLASIIPTPTRFKYTFSKEGTLRDFYLKQADFIMKTMLSRGQVLPEDTTNSFPWFEFTGPAKNHILPSDSLSIDSLLFANP